MATADTPSSIPDTLQDDSLLPPRPRDCTLGGSMDTSSILIRADEGLVNIPERSTSPEERMDITEPSSHGLQLSDRSANPSDPSSQPSNPRQVGTRRKKAGLSSIPEAPTEQLS